jgi:hypothetical protein
MLILAGLVFALLQSAPASSNRGNLSIEGAIKDPSGALFSGVLVFIKTEDLLVWTNSDESGRYRFANLKPGQYELIVILPLFITVKRSVNLTTSITQDEDLKVLPTSTCGCISAVLPMPPHPDVLRSASDRLRRVTLRMEDLRPAADLDTQRRQLLNDFEAYGSYAIPALKDLLDDDDNRVRINATVVLYDLFSSPFNRKYVAYSGVIYSLARASTNADPTLRQYALVTLNSALKGLE